MGLHTTAAAIARTSALTVCSVCSVWLRISVPIPTRLRVECWSFSFMALLNDTMGRREFMTYLEKEFSGKTVGCSVASKPPPNEGIEKHHQSLTTAYVHP